MGGVRDRLSTLLLVLMGLTGLVLIAYPSFSDWWNSTRQSYVIADYDQMVQSMDPHVHDEAFAEAEAYNERLRQRGVHLTVSQAELDEYNALLNVTGNGMMGYVDIPKIDVTLPIYHGTSDAVLQVAVGHLPGTSLPVGGLGTHAAISGHRGLPSAKLFTDLDRMGTGDLFTITILDRIFTYEVDQVRIILPYELDDLAIDAGRDYVTLVTCTPYGVNTHRLLVRGHRVDNAENAVVVLADAIQIDPRTIALIVSVPVLLVLLAWLLLFMGQRSRYRRKRQAVLDEFQGRQERRLAKADADDPDDGRPDGHGGN